MSILLTFRPVDREWVMGDDMIIDVDNGLRLDSLFKVLSDKKRIPKSRFKLHVPPDRFYAWENGKVGGKADWTVRRAGFYSKSIIKIEPIFPLAWLWHDLDWYEASYIEIIRAALEGCGEARGLSLQELAAATEKPPPLRCTLRAFLRKWPDKFHMEVSPPLPSRACPIF